MQARPRWTFGQFAWLFLWSNTGGSVGLVIVLFRMWDRGAIDRDSVAAGELLELSFTAEDLVILLVAQSVGAIVYLVYLSMRHGTTNWAADFGLRLVPFRISGVFIGFVLQLVVVGLSLLFLPFGEPAQGITSEIVDARSSDMRFVLGFLVVVLVPIVEEIMFRALLLSRLYFSLPGAAAIGISAVAFAAVHFPDANVWALPGLVVAGVVLAWFTLRDRDLSRAVPIHMGFNLTSVVALYALPM